MAEMFGHYEILEKLGQGNQVTVFRAMDTSLRREVIIKQSNHLPSSDAAYAEAFQREARTASGLSHTNIVTVYETGIEDDISYIAMECVPHVLSSILESWEPLPLERVLAIGTQICLGLNRAHTRGVIHRDIKAYNILINDEGEAKITDFGIGRATEASTRPESISIMCTSPTCLLSGGEARRWTGDQGLYSLGILLYETLNGTVPFTGEMSHILRNIKSREC